MVETSFDRYLKEEKQSSFAEGREEGRSVESIDTVKRMLAKGSYSLDEIAEISNLPIDKVRELAQGA